MPAQSSTETAIAAASLDGFFSSSVRNFPQRPALVVDGKTWTYGELNVECGRIERALRQTGAAGRRSNVGLIYGRSAFTYASIIATMRSRSVYVPLNPKVPADRLSKMIADSGMQTLIIDGSEGLTEGVIGALERSPSLQLIVEDRRGGESLNGVLERANQHAVTRISEVGGVSQDEGSSLRDDDPAGARPLAYIIFTSGSTGVPKGVPITHDSACRCIEKFYGLFGTNELDRFSQFSALSFDVSIADIFLCWRSGAALCVPSKSEALVPMSFARTQKITVWSSVPSLANILLKLRLLHPGALPDIRLSLFCGEALPTDLARAWEQATPGSRVINLYGPTEVTIAATYYEYRGEADPGGAVVPIGKPLPGVGVVVVAEERAIYEEDVPGELWLAGDQLAGGYLNNPAATQTAFVQRRFDDCDTDKWYRTGDLVAHGRGGVGLVFRGRIDRQVKLRGYRIELQEVEYALREMIGCALVAAVAPRGPNGICEKLIVYCDRLDADEATLKARCASRMPHYMIPDRILRLDVFPLNDSGKVNYPVLLAQAAQWAA